MNNKQHLLGLVRKACEQYEMIGEGDKIAVGISGGKDSLTLLSLLADLRLFYPKKFSLVAVSIDMGFPTPNDYTEIATFCQQIGVDFQTVKTDIYKIIFEERKEENPCALCANLRRGALADFAVKNRCNSIALGHHNNDVTDTLLMNLFFEGRLASFFPVTKWEDKNINLIRPMIDIPEKDIITFAKNEKLPILQSKCPADKKTEREHIGELVNNLEKHHRGVRHRIYLAMKKNKIDGYFEKGE